MKSKLTLFLFIWFLLMPLSHVLAEERNIYVGDLIELKVTTQAFSQEELREKFSDFEIVSLENKPDGYLLTLRTFETGEKIVHLGDKEIIIHVQSTLDLYDRTGVFEGSTDVQKPGGSPDWRILVGVSALLFLVSGGILLGKAVQNRKLSRLTPLQKFMQAVSHVSLEDKDALVQLTYCLKVYLESTFSFRILGKTSAEILRELTPIAGLQEKLPEIRSWLEECDYLKFSGNEGSMEKKRELYNALKVLVDSIETIKQPQKEL